MARRRRSWDEQNLTALRALTLLLDASKAVGGGGISETRMALINCRDALEKHVRYHLRSKRR
jgi:hypothetical protein